MDIAALVNPVSEAPPRRSPSGSHNILAPSPATSNAKLPTPPMSTNSKPLSRKRKRHDPKPIWAVRENELFDGQSLQQHLSSHRKEESRPPPPTPQPQPQPPPDAIHNGPPPTMAPGPPQPLTSHELSGYERPISDDATIYDEIARKVCDFIWGSVIENESVRKAIVESPDTQIEIEARWGQIQDRNSGQRVGGIHASECVVLPGVSENTKFESTMTMEQHKRMNNYLNGQVQKSQAPGAMRARVDYKHTKEVDQFFVLDQEGFSRLPPATRAIVGQAKTRQRIRVTRDIKNTGIIGAIIKHRIANLEISSPNTEWDYRIGVNLEINFPGPIDGLQEIVEPGKSVEAMKRYKDRVSYAWLGAYQVDLTQVSQDSRKNHELELELNSGVLMENANNVQQGQPNQYESLINGMMNNLRVLSREITPPAA